MEGVEKKNKGHVTLSRANPRKISDSVSALFVASVEIAP